MRRLWLKSNADLTIGITDDISSITMVGISTVTTKGQATIPEAIRSYLGIVPGDSLYFEIDPAEKVVKFRRKPKSIVDELAGSLHSSVPYMDISAARQKAGEALGKIYEAKKS
ncbi:MAG: hypothetical protein AAB660_02340 [Patescibacteria group bacterium]